VIAALVDAAKAWCCKEMVHDLVTWGLVILGWIIVSRGNDKRERRKEIRSQLDKLARELRDLEQEARVHFLAPGSDPEARAREVSLRWRVKNAIRLMDRLALGEIKCESDKKSALRQAVTGGDFDSPERVASEATAPKLQAISEAVAEIVDALEKSFLAVYTSLRKNEGR
jgi:hypothetical protein